MYACVCNVYKIWMQTYRFWTILMYTIVHFNVNVDSTMYKFKRQNV